MYIIEAPPSSATPENCNLPRFTVRARKRCPHRFEAIKVASVIDGLLQLVKETRVSIVWTSIAVIIPHVLDPCCFVHLRTRPLRCKLVTIGYRLYTNICTFFLVAMYSAMGSRKHLSRTHALRTLPAICDQPLTTAVLLACRVINSHTARSTAMPRTKAAAQKVAEEGREMKKRRVGIVHVAPLAQPQPESPGGVSPSSGLDRRALDPQRNPSKTLSYDAADRFRIARKVTSMFPKTTCLRVVDFGAGYGHFLVELNKDLHRLERPVGRLIGIDGFETTKGDPFDPELVRIASTDTEVVGLDKPCTFANAAQHPIATTGIGELTFGHFYEGGVFDKQTTEDVLRIAASFASGSVLVVVISTCAPIFPETSVTEQWLVETATRAGMTVTKRVRRICEQNAPEPSMRAVILRNN